MSSGTNLITLMPDFHDVMKATMGRHNEPIPVTLREGTVAHVIVNNVTHWLRDGFAFVGQMIRDNTTTPVIGEFLSYSDLTYKGYIAEQS